MTQAAILDGNWNAWADIVIRIWKQKLIVNRVGQYNRKGKDSDNTLFASFERHILNATGGDVQRIEFLFKYCGIFVDMGVGKGTPYGTKGSGKRRPKEWYSKAWFGQVMKLREHMSKQVGQAAANTIIFGLRTTVRGSLGNNGIGSGSNIREGSAGRNMMNNSLQII